MRITRDDNCELCVVDFPWGWGVAGVLSFSAVVARLLYEQAVPAESQGHPLPMLICGAFIAFGGLLFSTRVSLRIDLARKTVAWSRVGITGARREELRIDEVRRAVLRLSNGSSNRTPSWRLALETVRGELPLSFTFSLGDAARQKCFDIARRIEAGLALGKGNEQSGDLAARSAEEASSM